MSNLCPNATDSESIRESGDSEEIWPNRQLQTSARACETQKFLRMGMTYFQNPLCASVWSCSRMTEKTWWTSQEKIQGSRRRPRSLPTNILKWWLWWNTGLSTVIYHSWLKSASDWQGRSGFQVAYTAWKGVQAQNFRGMEGVSGDSSKNNWVIKPEFEGAGGQC